MPLSARRLLAFLICCVAACWPGWVLAATDADTDADGLIVRLQGMPAHHDFAKAQAQGRGAGWRRSWRARWQGVVDGAGLPLSSGWRVAPFGRSSLLLSPPSALSIRQLAAWRERLARQPEVAWVELHGREQRLQSEGPTPQDPWFAGLSGQWWLQPVSGSNAQALPARLRGVPGFQPAWSLGTGDASVVVAVLDTGITDHPDLDSARLLPGFDLVSDAAGARDGDGRDSDPHDPGDGVSAAHRAAEPTRLAQCAETTSSWHGTAVTGLIAARSGNGWGGAGADWGARILPVRVAGQCGASLRDIIDGMRWAAGLDVCQRWADSQDPTAGCAQWAPVNPNPARVINLSFGGAADCGSEYQAAVDELWALGIVVVAPAGNQHAAPARPANCRHVIGVAALNRDGFKANYSNFGELTIATVGGDDAGGLWGGLLADSGLLAPHNDGLYGLGQPVMSGHFGSSFAAPVVTAAVSLMLAADPALRPEQIVAGLQASARPHVQSPWMALCSADNPGRCLCNTAQCGAGILDAEQAVRYARALAGGQRYQAPSWVTAWLDTQELASASALGQDREPIASSSGGSSGGTGGGAMPAWMGLLLLGLARSLRRP